MRSWPSTPGIFKKVVLVVAAFVLIICLFSSDSRGESRRNQYRANIPEARRVEAPIAVQNIDKRFPIVEDGELEEHEIPESRRKEEMLDDADNLKPTINHATVNSPGQNEEERLNVLENGQPKLDQEEEEEEEIPERDITKSQRWKTLEEDNLKRTRGEMGNEIHGPKLVERPRGDNLKRTDGPTTVSFAEIENIPEEHEQRVSNVLENRQQKNIHKLEKKRMQELTKSPRQTNDPRKELLYGDNLRRTDGDVNENVPGRHNQGISQENRPQKLPKAEENEIADQELSKSGLTTATSEDVLNGDIPRRTDGDIHANVLDRHGQELPHISNVIRNHEENQIAENELPLQNPTKRPVLDSGQRKEVLYGDNLKRTDGDINVNGHLIDTKNSSTKFTARPFNVHLVLHSHVDPGWLRTFEEYFQESVKNIIDGAVRGLTRHKELKFIWSEMSFLERWWRQANETMRTDLRNVLNEGRLELCGGAWVMTDEATPHFFSTIDNMIEGQQYIYKEMNTTAISSWSVDPFGHGTMMPLLLSLSGIHNMVIGRLNDVLKESLRRTHNLRWKWVQPYEMDERIKSPNVNTLPYLYYTTRNACGPNQATCCESHIGRAPTNHFFCREGMDGYIRRKDMTKFRQYVGKLVEQWKILQTLYDSDEVLVPLGDDFYLTNLDDWDSISMAWTEFFKIVNNDDSFGVKVKFSTVTEYFDAVKKKESFPKLNGDFFPYLGIERDPHKYWVGYFTHRPHHKRMERIVMSQLRALDLLKVVSGSTTNLDKISLARRDLALFQHHDGITGTSKPHVMDDYLKRMRKASTTLLSDQSSTLKKLFQKKREIIESLRSPNDSDLHQPPHNNYVLQSEGDEVNLLVFNQHVAVRKQKIVVYLNVKKPEITVLDSTGKEVPAQLAPNFDGKGSLEKGIHELIFFADLPPLRISEFKVIYKKSESTAVAEIMSNESTISSSSDYRTLAMTGETVAATEFINLKMNNGIVGSLEVDRVLHELSVTYETYDDHSGAYVFEGRERKQSVAARKLLYISKGPLETQIVSLFGDSGKGTSIWQVVRLFNVKDAKHLSHALELQLFPWAETNQDIFMRITSAIGNRGEFSTDINAMYFQQRNYNSEKPLAANIFATPTAGFVQDQNTRLSVLVAQPCGMTSKEDGSLLVHVDRRTGGDDGKGLSYGEALENRRAHTRYRILLEPRKSGESSGCCHSITGQNSLDTLLHTPAVFFAKSKATETVPSLKHQVDNWPCAIQLVNMRHLTDKEILIVLRRIAFDETINNGATCSTDLTPVWDFLSKMDCTLRHTTLTGTKDAESVTMTSLEDILQKPLTIASIKCSL